MNDVIVDTGPLVALLNPRDPFHRWASDALGAVEAPLLTCEAVLTETAYLVRDAAHGPEAALELVRHGVVKLAFHMEDELLALRTLVSRYTSIPMSLADACLVRMAEMQPGAKVMTLDGDFRVYRRSGRLSIPVIMPSKG